MDDKERKRELYREVETLVKKEKALRTELGIGERYRVISSRLEALLAYVHAAVSRPKQEAISDRVAPTLTETQQYVFIHLFNNKGKILSRWEPMLSPRNLSEYSVNRPIYAEQNQIEAYIRSRPNDDEHAFLMMKIEKSDILHGSDITNNRDPLGQVLLKLKEGSLQEQNLVYFFHKGGCYIFTHGHLVLHQP